MALARAYTEWVAHEPHVHDLDLAPHIDKSEHPWLQAAAIRCGNLLHDTVEACQPPRVSEGDLLRRCAMGSRNVPMGDPLAAQRPRGSR